MSNYNRYNNQGGYNKRKYDDSNDSKNIFGKDVFTIINDNKNQLILVIILHLRKNKMNWNPKPRVSIKQTYKILYFWKK